MKIGIKLEDARYDNIDMSAPDEGNPGIGGTSYEELLLAKKLSDKGLDVIVYHTNNKNVLPKNVQSVIVQSIKDIPERAANDNIDILIFSAGRDLSWYDDIEYYNLKGIVWAHVFLNYYELKRIRKCDAVKRVVFVGRQEYFAYVADDIIEKSTYIYNMYNSEKSKIRDHIESKQVVYLGALNRNKGFHVLAQAWKTVLEAVPDAELVVLGNGKVYGRNTPLGKYGIATPNYEKKFMKYIIDENNVILPSVHFHGIVGNDKDEIISKASVGVVNPTGLTETFCISAIEIEACGVPICTTGKYGLLDTVIDNKTGLFSDDYRDLAKNIIELLLNNEKNLRFGRNAIEHASKFVPEIIINEWIRVLDEIINDIPAEYIAPSTPDLRLKRKIRLRRWRIEMEKRFLPSFIQFEYLHIGMTRVWLKDIYTHYFGKKSIMND